MIFWRDSLVPLMGYIQDVLETQFFEPHAPELEGLFDTDTIEALQEDYNQKVNTASAPSNTGCAES